MTIKFGLIGKGKISERHINAINEIGGELVQIYDPLLSNLKNVEDFFKYDLVSVGSGEFGLPQTLAAMSKDYPIKVEKARIWQPIGCPEDLEKAEKVLHKFGVKIEKPKKTKK